MHTGPNIERDGLVFGYDTGYGVADNNTGTRFYSGNPTSNIVPDAYTMSGWGNYSAGNDGTFITEYGTTGYKVRNKDTWNGIVKGIALPSTGTYTISAWFRIWGKSSGNNGINVYTNGGGISDTAQGGDDTKIGEWQRIAMTRTYSTTSINFYIISWGGTRGVDWSSWDVTMPQIEKQITHSPFLTGTRSSTQSLIDLTRTTDIDVSNVSFDSTGQPVFDGTDDDIDLGSDITFKTSGGWSVESVVKYNSVAGSYNNVTSPANFIGSDSISYNSWYWSVLSGKLALWNISPGVWKYGSTILQQDTWYHVTIVSSNDGTSYQMYLNGVAEGGDHTTYNWNPSYSGLKIRYIGRGNTSNRRLVNGNIPITKVYDRVLTPEEVKQNYNSHKNRFGI